MQNAEDATTGAKTGKGLAATRERAAMMTVQDVAEALQCSARTVYRLADSGRMPRPVKLGALVRWPRQVIEQWIADGCPRCERRRAGHAR
ncbi:MAG: helix-turn-helix domain-containing protein [Candidatus Brocadiia bacterium]